MIFLGGPRLDATLCELGGLLSEGILRFEMLKTLRYTKIPTKNSLKKLTLTVHGLMLGRAYYRKDICACDLEGLFSGGLEFYGIQGSQALTFDND